MKTIIGRFNINSLKIDNDGEPFIPPKSFVKLKKREWDSLLRETKNIEHLPWNGKVYRLSNVSHQKGKTILHLNTIDFKTHYASAFSQNIFRGKHLSKCPNGMYIGAYIKTKDNKLVFGINSNKGLAKNEVNFIGGILSKDEMVINDTSDLFKFFTKEFEEETSLNSNLINNISGLGVFLSNNYRIGVILMCNLNMLLEEIIQKASLNFEHKELLFINPNELKKTTKKYQFNSNISGSYHAYLRENKSSPSFTNTIPISKPLIGKEEINSVVKVLKSGLLTQGSKTEEFEKEFARYIGTKYALATTSGTASLFLALLSWGLKNGDEVITTPFSFIASSDSCRFVGAKPVFVDINEKTFNIDSKQIEKKITSKTKAILITHLFGLPCQMDTIMDIAKKYKLILIEDSCQAHGAEFNGKKVGSFGTGCFSFYATKNMTTGQGGMITTNSKSLAEKIKLLRTHGYKTPYHSEILGYNFCMTDFQAGLGIEQLKKLNIFNRKRTENAKYLSGRIKGTRGIIIPEVPRNTKHVFHQYTIRVTQQFPKTRNQLLEILRNKGVDARIFYPTPIYKQESYKKVGYKDNLPITERTVKTVISLPIHPSVNKPDLDFMAKAIIEVSGD